MIRPEFAKVLVDDRVRALRAEAKHARRVRLIKARKR
jgi:hypothetical protein